MRRWITVCMMAAPLWLMGLDATDIVSKENVDKATATIAESSVFGSAFVVMLAVLLVILGYLLWQIASERKAHKKEREEQDKRHAAERLAQDERHAKERKADKKAFDDRHDKAMVRMEQKDTTIGEIQEKRVVGVVNVVGALADVSHKIDRLTDAISGSVEIVDEDEPQ